MSFWERALKSADRVMLRGLGGPIIYRTQDGTDIAVERAVFENAYLEVAGAEAPIASASPAIFIRLDDLVADGAFVDPTADKGRVIRDGRTYRVKNVKKDGEGGAVIILRPETGI